MTEQAQTKNGIHQALLSVYAKVGYVQKLGKNTMQNYKYASESDLIAALRPVMIEEGIIMYPAGIERHNEVVLDKDGKPRLHVSNIYTFRFVHAPTGEFIDVQAAGEGIGNDDKSSYKAATGAQKYAIRQAFLIETGDDPDQDAQPIQKPVAAPKPTPKPPAAPATPKATMNAIPIPILQDGSGYDWQEYGTRMIVAIKAVKTKGEFLAFRDVNNEGLDRLADINPDIRAQVSAVAGQKMKENGWNKQQPKAPTPSENSYTQEYHA